MKKILVIFIIFVLFPKTILARSGCCSHHGGVCGCGCCDGTSLSNTCAPYYPDCSHPIYVAPVVTKMPFVYTTSQPTAKPEIKVIVTPGPTPESNNHPNDLNTVGLFSLIVFGGWASLKWLSRKSNDAEEGPTQQA